MNEEQISDTTLSEIVKLGENRIHRLLIRFLLMVMAVEWVLLLLDQRWLSLFLITLIIITLIAPIIFRRKMEMEIPAELHIAAKSLHSHRSISVRFKVSITLFGGGIFCYTLRQDF